MRGVNPAPVFFDLTTPEPDQFGEASFLAWMIYNHAEHVITYVSEARVRKDILTSQLGRPPTMRELTEEFAKMIGPQDKYGYGMIDAHRTIQLPGMLYEPSHAERVKFNISAGVATEMPTMLKDPNLGQGTVTTTYQPKTYAEAAVQTRPSQAAANNDPAHGIKARGNVGSLDWRNRRGQLRVQQPPPKVGSRRDRSESTESTTSSRTVQTATSSASSQVSTYKVQKKKPKVEDRHPEVEPEQLAELKDYFSTFLRSQLQQVCRKHRLKSTGSRFDFAYRLANYILEQAAYNCRPPLRMVFSKKWLEDEIKKLVEKTLGRNRKRLELEIVQNKDGMRCVRIKKQSEENSVAKNPGQSSTKINDPWQDQPPPPEVNLEQGEVMYDSKVQGKPPLGTAIHYLDDDFVPRRCTPEIMNFLKMTPGRREDTPMMMKIFPEVDVGPVVSIPEPTGQSDSYLMHRPSPQKGVPLGSGWPLINPGGTALRDPRLGARRNKPLDLTLDIKKATERATENIEPDSTMPGTPEPQDSPIYYRNFERDVAVTYLQKEETWTQRPDDAAEGREEAPTLIPKAEPDSDVQIEPYQADYPEDDPGNTTLKREEKEHGKDPTNQPDPTSISTNDEDSGLEEEDVRPLTIEPRPAQDEDSDFEVLEVDEDASIV